MILRLTASLLAITTVCAAVYAEFVLSYSGLMGGREAVYAAGYEVLLGSTFNESIGDSLLTVVVYTLPECISVLVLYHVYAMLGRTMGLAPNKSD
ncbi:MAG: hypothetical protein AB8C95_10865 [Phycisphaeraceae bacterium]